MPSYRNKPIKQRSLGGKNINPYLKDKGRLRAFYGLNTAGYFGTMYGREETDILLPVSIGDAMLIL